MKTITLALLITVLSLTLGACNTTRGFGQDIQEAGEALEQSADKHDDDS
ncbi:MAG TPA: entericidin A/B family lipoprotein [Xanthomonadales bacterium]|nr:entericidin A/B family lipoprotein [Xanthomonadales bacterium]